MKASGKLSAILAVAVASASVLSFASCGKQGDDQVSTTAPATTAAVTDAGPTDVQYVPNVTKPSYEADTIEVERSRVNEYATEPDGDGSFVTEVGSVQFVYPEYFAQGNSYVSIKEIVVDDQGFTSKADAYVDFAVLARGEGEDKVKVSYIGYDANGEITRRSQITVNLFGLNVGEISEGNRMDFKRETVKIVFTEFKEITE